MTTPNKSIYQRAGEWGVPFGLYLACTGVASIFADRYPTLGLVFFLLLLGTPVVTFAFQRHKFIEDGRITEHAGLWMLGIMMYILGTVLASFIIYLVLQYVRPGYLYEQAQAAIDAYSRLPQTRDSEMLRVLRRMVDEKLVPTPIEVVVNAFWFVAFGGSVVSAVTAYIVRRANKNKTDLTN